MDSISYRGIEMTILQSLSWEREAMFDPSGTTYECTRWRGSVIVSYNPGAVSFTRPIGDPSQIPPPAPGRMPAVTDNAIRRFLEYPRGELIVKSAGNIVLQSPQFGADSDVRSGPFVRINSIVEIPGERLWKIHLNFETYINEARNQSGKQIPPLITSNRWYAIDDINWQHLRTRTYQGICTVRGDILRKTGAQPVDQIDYFRDQFMAFSVPVGFQREKVHVTITPDGNSAHYTVIDTEQMFSKGLKCPAVRVEVADTNWISTSGMVKAVTSASLNVVRALRAVTGIRAGQQPREVQEQRAQILSKMNKNVLVRVWGNRITRRTDLMLYAMSICISRMGTAAIFDTTLSEFIVSQDTNNFVQINYTKSWGPDVGQTFLGTVLGGSVLVAQQLLFGGVVGPGQAAFRVSIGQNPDTLSLVNGTALTQGAKVNPVFPASSGTRGTAAIDPPTSLKYLVSQALEFFDGSPQAPTFAT